MDTHAYVSGAVSARPGDREIGRLTHQLIQSLLREGHRSPPAWLIVAAAGELGRGLPPTLRAIVRGRCAPAAASYFHRFVLPDPWMLVDSEVACGSYRVDLLWQHSDGRLLVDELKTQRLLKPLWRREAIEQALRYVETCTRRWGDQFIGVRLIWTQAPERSLFVASDGGQEVLSNSVELWT